ncbi:sentrin-specific protease 7 isoform X2 [Larimichthys crocea]|uniref:sentrin-specific protease 7 isoform X2 n=1 Tax=Larimichthys crocea TaxID=215358 RepID=UPI000900EA19|nr:sentrin-specific protease 7 isoform X2 [Larimichthys crocea]XP_027147068.1 sentrin-specific protease 7 isoform X2 [Larimichthys crocea]XP_027147069.1 sentrin-specific protease 7 isoform X2 [Larimichthys crocea]XP_027147070.1 sentrin-specific protease 7 isoform X2 [Larimichthys crocea]
MMERRNALTLPFNVDKDNLVSWTEFSCKRRHSDLQHKNGSVMLDTANITLEMERKKPCLILTDVLKTARGRTYMERIKQSCAVENGGQVSSSQRESGHCREKPALCTDRRSSHREAKNAKNKSVHPKCSPKTPSITPSPHRSRLKRRLQNAGDDVDREEKDIEEVIIGKDCGEDYRFADVVDCGLSVSWDPAEDKGSCDEFSPTSIKDKCTDPEKEVQHSVKRKIKGAGSHCNGTSSPKRHRESVLRLTGEDGRDGGPAPTHVCQEDGGEDVDLESLDRSIVQFTVGTDDPAEILLPIIISNKLEAGDILSSQRQSVLSSQDNTTSEPIVLSSDEEESCDVPQRCSPLAHTLLTVEDAVTQRQSQQDALAKEQETSDLQDMQVLHVVVEDLPRVAVSLDPGADYSCMGVAFSSLFCGGYQGKSNGDIMVTDDKIMIPLKDTSEKVALMLNVERKELRRYSVWEQQELEAQELHFEDEAEPIPPSALLLGVSETAAAAIHRDLHKLYVKQGAPSNIGTVSPFVLLTLRDPLEGMEGALLRSLLDIDCLNCLSDEKSIFHDDAVCDLYDIQTPVLTLDDSIKLIRRTGRDSHLLALLGLESTDPTFNTDQHTPHTETDKDATPLIQLEANPQKETILEVETETEGDAGTRLKPEEEHKEQKPEHPTEKKKKEEPTPVYTLCHRRTKGSYSVSLCKPDSSWIKYKHQGLPHRLIQFPPPPLKGGITVTMEDLQCLDSGQFLNDVIIDFYLKYLLHKASPAVTERSHIFSSFFYKQLTRRDNASEGSTSDSCQRQRRHQRVKTWTRHVDIFKKDFLFVPVNQEAHWYLVVICFPGLAEPKTETWNGPNSQTGKNQSETDKLQDQEADQGSKSPNDNTETQPATSASNHSDQADTATEKTQEEPTKDAVPSPVNCTEQTYQKKTVCKRPCILIMDSLKRSLHERVFKLLRDYLESEWEVRRGSSREFSPDQMQSSHCQVPLQDNSSDCGLYLLQYVESFLKDPVVHFDLPLHLQRWFPRQQVRRKRDEIRDLVLNLYRHQNLESNR